MDLFRLQRAAEESPSPAWSFFAQAGTVFDIQDVSIKSETVVFSKMGFEIAWPKVLGRMLPGTIVILWWQVGINRSRVEPRQHLSRHTRWPRSSTDDQRYSLEPEGLEAVCSTT